VTTNQEGSPPDRKARKPVRLVISVLLMAAALWFLWRTGSKAGWDNLGRRLAEVSLWMLLAAVSVNLARYGVWAARWQWLLRPVAHVGWWPAQRALMASVFYNTAVPGARPFGGIIRARYLARSTGQEPGPLFGGALVDQLGYSLVSMTLGLVFLPGAFVAERSGGGRWLIAPAVAALAVVVAVAWRRRERLVEKLRERMPHAIDTLTGTFRSARKLLARPSSWAIVLAGGVLVWMGNILTFLLAADALGAEIPVLVAAAAFSLGSLAGVASGSPGGAGTTEAAAIVPLVSLGVPDDLALASVLLARGIHYLSAILIGGICALTGR
jgi:uncharacterized protein (TIRG00374 family)